MIKYSEWAKDMEVKQSKEFEIVMRKKFEMFCFLEKTSLRQVIDFSMTHINLFKYFNAMSS